MNDLVELIRGYIGAHAAARLALIGGAGIVVKAIVSALKNQFPRICGNRSQWVVLLVSVIVVVGMFLGTGAFGRASFWPDTWTAALCSVLVYSAAIATHETIKDQDQPDPPCQAP